MRTLFGKVWLIGVPDGSLVAHGKFVAAFGAAARNYGTPVFSLHARSESMCLRPLAIIRLKSTLWHLLSLCGRYIGSDALPGLQIY